MRLFHNISIRKKILVSVLAFTLLPVILITSVALSITYNTMRDQLIYDRRMNIGWLQSLLSIDLDDTLERFYDFEVNKTVKFDILSWCGAGKEIDYTARQRLIAVMNNVINMDNRINSVELFNYALDRVLIAKRAGAYMTDTKDRLSLWNQRDKSLQTNLVYLRDGRELLACHQIYRFKDRSPIALVVIRMRPYGLERILENIKTIPSETVLLFSDENQLIESNYGTDWALEAAAVETVRKQLAEKDTGETVFADQFWFYRTVNNGKLQILLTVPIKTIKAALKPTILSGILMSLAAVAAGVTCSAVYARAVTRPIIDLSDRMRSMRLDEHTESMADDRRDEIGILQRSFDSMIARNRELIASQYQSELEKRNAQLKALQAQINPHFMYNTLQVIYGMALEKSAPEIGKIAIALSDILRYSLKVSRDFVPLKEELRCLENYILIQQARFGERIKIETAIAPRTLDLIIPKLILQPLAENSFEHGFADKSGEWKIFIESQIVEDDLVLCFRDNGVGISEQRLAEIRAALSNTDAALRSVSHIGLANVDARIKLHCPGNGYGVSIESQPECGTTIRVRLHRLAGVEPRHA